MSKPEFVSQTVAAMLVGLMVCVVISGFERYADIYRPQDGVTTSLRFIAQKLPQREEARSPLSLRRASFLREQLADLPTALFVRTMLPVRRGEELRREGILFVSEDFGRLTGLRVVAGRQRLSRSADDATVPCWVSERFASSRQPATEALGTVLVTAGRSCTVVGVVGPLLDYWMPGASILARLADHEEFPGSAVPDNDRSFAVHFLVDVRGSASTDGRLLERAAPTAAGDDLPLHIVSVPDYLFSKAGRRAAKLAIASAALGTALCVVVLLVWFTFEADLRDSAMRTHAVLGASVVGYLLFIWRKRAGTTGVGSILVLPLNMFVLQEIFPEGRFDEFGFMRGTAVITFIVTLALAGGVHATRFAALTRSTALTRPAGFHLASHSLTALHCIAPVLIVMALAYQRSYIDLAHVSLGMDIEKVTAFQLGVRPGAYSIALIGELRELERAVSMVPAVTDVGFSVTNPVLDLGHTSSVTIEGVGRFLNGESSHVTPGRQLVGPGFVRSVGGRILAGRDFSWVDSAHTGRVVLVNESAVKAYWKDRDPIGRRLKFGRPREAEPWATIVGVVSDIQHEGYRGAVKPEIYLSVLCEELSLSSFQLLVRSDTPVNAAAVEGLLARRRGLTEFEGRVSLAVAAEAAVRELKLAGSLFTSIGLASILGYVAGLLLCIVAEIERGRREIAVRIALGSSHGRLVRDRLKRSILRPATASVAGVVCGFVAISLLRQVDYDVALLGPWYFAAAGITPLLLVVLGTLASGGHYRRVGPADLLRC
jgi:hypothetical protein